MFTTGNTFTDALLLITSFLPLIPAALIFFSKNSGESPLNLLLVICLLNFIQGLIKACTPFGFENQYITNNILSLLELILLTQLFKPLLSRKMKDVLNILLVAFLSAIITYFSLEGWSLDYPGLDTLQNGIIIGVILVSLPPLMKATNLRIFQSPLFWIAGGTLFYFLIFTLLEWVGPCCLPAPRSLPAEKMIFLGIAGLIRYVLYILAALVPRPEQETE